eukprot:TRINITY_DN12603_c0_g1_i1.p1 TRINITY_DN12603_c0_g1~~TRINITY_DN12603_c0_g1_i1.p1  ORF type:complete len:120 (-),score=7.25 TRINITY_DN12603_c0_g1_i1:129-488(-)
MVLVGFSDQLSEHWPFDVNGYPADKGFTMQRQNMYMDYGIFENILQTQTGDIVVGNSGGPAHFGNSIYAVVSHEIFLDYSPYGVIYYANGFTRITQPKYDSMCAYIMKWSMSASNWNGC